MSLPTIHLSKEDFASCRWEDVILRCDEREYQSYSTQFFREATKAGISTDTKAEAVFQLLGHVTSPMLRPDSDNEPFAPLEVFPNFRSAIPDDFSDVHLDVLRELAPEISDAEMRARVADILWVRKRDFRMAQLAITSYLESAQLLEDPEGWPLCVDRIKRAIRLAASIGKKNDCFTKIVAHIETVLDKYNGEDPLFLSAKLMELLQDYSQGDSLKYAALAEKVAIRAEAAHDWRRARTYWEIKAQWHILQKDADSSRAALISAAETYVRESNATLKSTRPSYMVAYNHIGKAIEALRRIGRTKERVEELHKTLLEYQQRALAEMSAIYTNEVDLSEYVQKTQEKVSGKALHDAFFTLATMGISPKVSNLRTQVQEAVRNYPFQHLISEVVVNKMGKVTARRPSIGSNNSQDIEQVIRAGMFKRARVNQQLYAQGIVEPARYQINLQHNVRLNDWLPIVCNNQLVPPGREEIYARGLQAGLTGDFLVAAHLLIPQLENSIRYLLNQEGVITSSLDDQGIQNERDLNTLLYSDEIANIFGEDILFDLQGLLVNRFGSNLRNQMAHGLIKHNEFLSLEVSYLWWLTLHLCCLPILAQVHQTEDEPSEPLEGSEDDAEHQ